MNIAVLGGRFDPPHIWHYWIAKQVIESIKTIDQVWYLPDFANALRPIVASSADRLAMIKFLETERQKVSTMAIDRGKTTYTIDIVYQLIKEGRNTHYWIIGSDLIDEFNKWRNCHKLSKLIKFLVFPREGYPIKSLPQNFYPVEGNLITSNISSSYIRRRVNEGLSIKGLVFPEVEEHIKKRNLYK